MDETSTFNKLQVTWEETGEREWGMNRGRERGMNRGSGFQSLCEWSFGPWSNGYQRGAEEHRGGLGSLCLCSSSVSHCLWGSQELSTDELNLLIYCTNDCSVRVPCTLCLLHQWLCFVHIPCTPCLVFSQPVWSVKANLTCRSIPTE